MRAYDFLIARVHLKKTNFIFATKRIFAVSYEYIFLIAFFYLYSYS